MVNYFKRPHFGLAKNGGHMDYFIFYAVIDLKNFKEK